MTQPIRSGAGFRTFEPVDEGAHGASGKGPDQKPPSLTDGQRAALDYCRSANSVMSGLICDERKVVSHACRKSSNPVDEFLCDDRKLENAQKTALQLAWDAFRALLLRK